MSDSMDEMFGDVDRVVRTALTMASQVAESKARQRDAQLREAAQREQEALRNLESAQRAQQEAARMVYGPLTDPRTFRQASVPTIEAGWQAAAAWADRDPRAAAAADAIRWNINERFGSDAAAAATLPQLALDVQVDSVLESASAREDAARTARAEADWQRVQADAHEDDARQELTTADRLDVTEELVDPLTAERLNSAEGEARAEASTDQQHATAHRNQAAAYDRAAESNLEAMTPEARTARQDSAALFSQPTAGSVAAYRAAGRRTRGNSPVARPTADRTRDTGQAR